MCCKGRKSRPADHSALIRLSAASVLSSSFASSVPSVSKLVGSPEATPLFKRLAPSSLPSPCKPLFGIELTLVWPPLSHAASGVHRPLSPPAHMRGWLHRASSRAMVKPLPPSRKISRKPKHDRPFHWRWPRCARPHHPARARSDCGLPCVPSCLYTFFVGQVCAWPCKRTRRPLRHHQFKHVLRSSRYRGQSLQCTIM